jgi:hypothetical protein
MVSKKWPLALLAFLSFGIASEAQADQCQSWTHKAYPVTMEACSYTNGGSGYAKITNDGSTAANVCWTVVLNDGREIKGCYTNMPAGESTSPSCFGCGSKNGGARHILLEKYQVIQPK